MKRITEHTSHSAVHTAHQRTGRSVFISVLVVAVVALLSLSACWIRAADISTYIGRAAALQSDTRAVDVRHNPPALNSDAAFNASLDASIQARIDALPYGTTVSVGHQKLDGIDTQHIVGSTGEMKSASVIKLWVAAAALQADTASDRQLEQMISYSHNLTTNDLADSVGGLDALNTRIYSAGYTNTRMEREMGSSTPNMDFWTTSADALTFLHRLYNNNVNGADKDAILLGHMLGQRSYMHDNGSDGAPNPDANKIRQAIEHKSGFQTLANKTGENTGAVANDVAIIYTDKGDFLLTIFCMGGDNASNVEFNRDVAALVYDAMLGLDQNNSDLHYGPSAGPTVGPDTGPTTVPDNDSYVGPTTEPTVGPSDDGYAEPNDGYGYNYDHGYGYDLGATPTLGPLEQLTTIIDGDILDEENMEGIMP